MRFGFFFFKQKTAYEMRISDWSSDVCSSDLGGLGVGHDSGFAARATGRQAGRFGWQGADGGDRGSATPTRTPEGTPMAKPDWSAIDAPDPPRLAAFFAADEDRVARVSVDVAGLHFSGSKTQLTHAAVQALAAPRH